MPEAFSSFDEWLLRTTVGGGVVLLIGTLWMILSRQPAQRQRIGELALLAALLVAVPAAFPSWWSIPGTTGDSATKRVLFGNGFGTKEARHSPFGNDSQQLAKVDGEDYFLDEENIAFVTMMHELQLDLEDLESAGVAVLPSKTIEDNCTKGSEAPISLSWLWWTLRAIGLAYLGLVVALLIRCSIGYYGLWRYWRMRRPAPAHVHQTLAELEPDLSRRPRIGVNSLVHGPVSYGLWKPTILLPPHFCNEGDPEKLRWILAHELTHLRRRDAWGCLLLALGGAIYFHVPWFWWMKRHVRLAQEYLADAAAVQFANAVEYAQYLVSLTTLTSRPTLASSQAASVFESPSDLYRRVHMLLHQRSVLERGAPRWWTWTAAASFLTLAACTAGINLYADEPAKKHDVVLSIVSDDDKNTSDKKSSEKKALSYTVRSADGKNFTWTVDDDKDQPHVLRLQGILGGDKQKQIDEAMKKLEQVLEKLPRQVDGDTRAKLEELKKTLKSLKESGMVQLHQANEVARDVEGKVRLRLAEAARQGEEQRKLALGRLQEVQKQAEAQRDQAVAAEKLARVAQERALTRWKDAKDGDDKDKAIKELERAIADKERALKALKSGDNATRIAPLYRLQGNNVASSPAAGSKGRLGVVVADIDGTLRNHLDIAKEQGLMIQEVIDPSPAWNDGNGLRSSDILLDIDGKTVPANQDQFREMVGKLNEGSHRATVLRKGKKMTINGIKLPGAEKTSKVVRDLAPTTADGLKVDFVPKINVDGHGVTLARPVDGKPGEFKIDLVPAVNNQVRDLVLGQVKLDGVNQDAFKVAGDLLLVDPKGTMKPSTVNFAPFVTTVQGAQQAGSKPRLGVTLEEVPEAVATQLELGEDRGLLVKDVVDGSAAQKAGFQKNDILIEFADKPVSRDHGAFTQFVKTLKAGKYTATVVRKGKEIRIRDINLADAKAAEEAKKAKAKEWVVERDAKEKAEADKDKAEEAKEAANKAKLRESLKKNRLDFFPNNGGFNFAGGNERMNVSINNDEFTATKDHDGKTITMKGKMVEGKAQPNSITIKTDAGEKKYKSVKEVPEGDRADVEKMLSSFHGNAFMWNADGFKLGNGQFKFNNELFNKQMDEQMKLLERSMKELDNGQGLEQMEKQIEQLRQQLRKMRRDQNNNDE